jgi:hypothetical protein
MKSQELHEKLSNWWEIIRDLKIDSSESDWELLTSYLAPDCTLYFGGMTAPASHGYAEVVANLKQTLTYWKMLERRVTAAGGDEAGTIFASMNNRLAILGEEIEFFETEVVSFDAAGLIKTYELYCDPSPIQAVFAKNKAK